MFERELVFQETCLDGQFLHAPIQIYPPRSWDEVALWSLNLIFLFLCTSVRKWYCEGLHPTSRTIHPFPQMQHVCWINFTSFYIDWGRSLQAHRIDGSTYGQLSMRPSDRWCNLYFKGSEWCSFTYKLCLALESSGFDFSSFITWSNWNSSSYKPLCLGKLHASLFVFPLSNLQ
jgi:hypothetical protein